MRLTRGRGGWGVVPGGNCGRGGKRLRHWVWAGIRFGSGEDGRWKGNFMYAKWMKKRNFSQIKNILHNIQSTEYL